MDTYEKKYTEALSRARQFSEHPLQEDSDSSVEYIFPELKESDDERIRKELIDYHRSMAAQADDYVHEAWIAWLEKQGDNPIKWNKNTKDYKPQKNHSVLMKTTHGIAEGEWQGVHWLQYRWSGIIKDSDVIAWIELSDLEKQGRQKPTWSEEDEQHIDSLLKRLDGLCRNEFERTRFAISEDKDWLKSLKERIGG